MLRPPLLGRAAAWRAAIREGDEQLDRGEGIPYGPDVLDNIAEEALRPLHSPRPMDPDVLP